MKLKNLFLSIILIFTLSSCNYFSHGKIYQDVEGIDETNESGISYWEEIPIRNEEQYNQNIGGEGCQWPLTIDGDKTGQYIYYGTDVGGIYRSTDYGKTFNKCMTDFLALGANDFEVDPNNNSIVLAMGVNGNRDSYTTGIYRSENYGESWTFMHHFPIHGARGVVKSICFDPSSYDSNLNYTKVVYVSLLYETDSSKNGLSEDEKGLYKSLDGGATFFLVNNDFSDSLVKVLDNGTVYIGNKEGLYESLDGGYQFNKILDAKVTGLDVVNDILYILTDNEVKDSKLVKSAAVYKIEDGLKKISSFSNENVDLITDPTWQPFFVNGGNDTRNEYHYDGMSHRLKTIKVSPFDPNKMIISYKNSFLSWADYSNCSLYTFDGGKTWHISKYQKTNEFFPLGNREIDFYYSPYKEDYIINFSNDILSASTDGGATFHYNNNGINGIMIGGKFNFNVYDNDILFISSQDYSGALTLDGGATWKYINLAQSNDNDPWNGYVYGGYAASSNVIFGAVSKSWGSDKYLSITYDGGKTIINHKNDDNYKLDSGKNNRLSEQGNYISFQSRLNPNLLFCGNLRSDDFGLTWTKMKGVTGVYDMSDDNILFGIDDNTSRVVYSTDEGLTWNTYVLSLSLNPYAKDGLFISDLAYDSLNDRLYIAAQWCALFVVTNHGLDVTELSGNIPKAMDNASMPSKDEINTYGDLYYARRVYSVAIDKNHPEILYIGGCANGYSSDSNVFRSCDMGKTFYCLTTNTATSIIKNKVYGGGGSICVRVNQKTGDLWSAGNCLGLSKITPPYETKSKSYYVVTLVSKYDNYINEIYVGKNRLLNLPTKSKKNKKFMGWYYDKEYLHKATNVIVNENMTLYAKWE